MQQVRICTVQNRSWQVVIIVVLAAANGCTVLAGFDALGCVAHRGEKSLKQMHTSPGGRKTYGPSTRACGRHVDHTQASVGRSPGRSLCSPRRQARGASRVQGARSAPRSTPSLVGACSTKPHAPQRLFLWGRPYGEVRLQGRSKRRGCRAQASGVKVPDRCLCTGQLRPGTSPGAGPRTPFRLSSPAFIFYLFIFFLS